MTVLWSLTCAAVILSLLQENNLSNSLPHRVKCQTVKHLSKSLEQWCAKFFVGGPYNQLQTSSWAT